VGGARTTDERQGLSAEGDPPIRFARSQHSPVQGAERWHEQGLEPIGLHESRHTTATWLDHAGAHPRSFSEFVGHKTPEYQLGAARITLQVYTHMLPGELERARTLFDEFLIERAEEDPAPGLALAKV
jgi:integrase